MHIGIDFDNTLVRYDELFVLLALEEGLVDVPLRSKRAVRDAVRAGSGGEMAWQRLQSLAYGPRMNGARLMDGAGRFLRACRERGIEVTVVSHKSRHASNAEVIEDLRECALAWMESQAFFVPDGLGLSEDRVLFADTRAEKVHRIAEIGPAVFIDDLEEVFKHPGFPAGILRLLFDPTGAVEQGPYDICRSFDEVSDVCFGAAFAD